MRWIYMRANKYIFAKHTNVYILILFLSCLSLLFPISIYSWIHPFSLSYNRYVVRVIYILHLLAPFLVIYSRPNMFYVLICMQINGHGTNGCGLSMFESISAGNQSDSWYWRMKIKTWNLLSIHPFFRKYWTSLTDWTFQQFDLQKKVWRRI